MAKSITSIAMNLTFLFALSLLIFSLSVESRTFSRESDEAEVSLQCNKVHGVESGDTCFGLAQTLKLSAARFNFFNPNLNCSALFVGQWLCVNAFLT